MNANDPVVVYTTNDPEEAAILRNYLESEGIQCELDGKHQAGLAGLLPVNLLVRAWDEERSRHLLTAHAQHLQRAWFQSR